MKRSKVSVRILPSSCWGPIIGPPVVIGPPPDHDTPDTAPPALTTDAAARKVTPLFSGVLNYFPLALAAVARMSQRGNDQHNPGQPLHWAREKSTDQEDCLLRHLVDVHTVDPETGEYLHAVAVAWRALALVQILEERRLGKPPSRGSR